MIATIVQCATCARFTPNERTPEVAVGSCDIGAWRTSKVPEYGMRSLPCWALTERICEHWRAKE